MTCPIGDLFKEVNDCLHELYVITRDLDDLYMVELPAVGPEFAEVKQKAVDRFTHLLCALLQKDVEPFDFAVLREECNNGTLRFAMSNLAVELKTPTPLPSSFAHIPVVKDEFPRLRVAMLQRKLEAILQSLR